MSASPALLPQAFYLQETTLIARQLLGKVICRRTLAGTILKARIVETEAYLGVDDPAAHTYRNRQTARNRSMYLEGGHAYIYFIYGMHYCLNIVTRTAAHPEAVLLRALEPIDSSETPSEFLPRSRPKASLLSNGPGKLCKYLGLTKDQDGVPLWSKTAGLWLLDSPSISEDKIVVRPRIGVDYAGEAAAWPLRFYINGNPYVSKK